MQQYFLHKPLQVHDLVEMEPEQAHHIQHVMRMKPDEIIRLADGKGHMYYAHVVFRDHKVFACVDEEMEDHTRTPVDMILAQGLIKKEKWDFLLQKSAELGVQRMIPFTSSRTVVKTKDEKVDKKRLRWNKILQEACEQCKRSTLVALDSPKSFAELIKASEDADVKLIAYERADVKSAHVKEVLQKYPAPHKVFIVVGCEGGFSEDEVIQLEEVGFHRVSLGARILRAETAALSLLACISFFYEMAGDHHENTGTTGK